VPEGAVTVKVEATDNVLLTVIVALLKEQVGTDPLVLMAAMLHERVTVPL
jgi:hypothetical protein